VGAGGAVGTVGSEVVVQQIGTGTKAKRTNDLHFETNSSIYVLSCEVGGVRDKLKADWDGQRFSHMRVQILRASHTKFAEEELKKHLEGKAPEDLVIKTPCMCAGSALGCLRENCPYWCGWTDLACASQRHLKTLKMYYAWCLSKGDGTCHQRNSVWMTDAQKATQKTTKNALAAKVQALVNASGFGPPGSPLVADDPSASAAVSQRTRTRSTGVGAPMTPAQKAMIPMPLETAGASVNDEANDAAGLKI
jgi:hypothetical protein